MTLKKMRQGNRLKIKFQIVEKLHRKAWKEHQKSKSYVQTFLINLFFISFHPWSLAQVFKAQNRRSMN